MQNQIVHFVIHSQDYIPYLTMHLLLVHYLRETNEPRLICRSFSTQHTMTDDRPAIASVCVRGGVYLFSPCSAR